MADAMEGRLLGMTADDLERLKAMMAQLGSVSGAMGPSDADRQEARKLGLLNFGLALAGARKGEEMQQLARAGVLGVGTYRDELRDLTAQRGQNLTQTMALQNMLRRSSFMDGSASGDAGPAQPGAAVGLRPFQIGGGAAGLLNLGVQPMTPGLADMMPNIAPPPEMPSVRELPASAPAQRTRTNPVEELRAAGATDWQIRAVAAAADPPAAFSTLMTELTKPFAGQNKIPLMRGPGGTWRAEMPSGYAGAVGEIASAETAATESAKAGFDLIPVPLGDGRTVMMTRADAVAHFRQRQQPAQAQQPIMNFSGSPEKIAQLRAAAMADFESRGATPQSAPMPSSGFGTTPNPLTMKAAEADIGTRASNEQKIAELAAGQVAQGYKDVLPLATSGIPLIHESRAALDSGRIKTGVLAPFKVEFGRWLVEAGFGDANNPTAATQAFVNTRKRAVLTTIKALGSGSGISDQDRKYAAEIEGADIALEEGAIRKLIDVSERVQRAQIRQHNAMTHNAAVQLRQPQLEPMFTVAEPAEYVAPANVGGIRTAAPSGGPGLTPAEQVELEALRKRLRR